MLYGTEPGKKQLHVTIFRAVMDGDPPTIRTALRGSYEKGVRMHERCSDEHTNGTPRAYKQSPDERRNSAPTSMRTALQATEIWLEGSVRSCVVRAKVLTFTSLVGGGRNFVIFVRGGDKTCINQLIQT